MRRTQMFACGIALALFSFATARADVYSKAFYWLRGMGVDSNGNGKLDSGELVDSLNLHPSTAHSNGSGLTVFTNETVKLPYRGVSRQMQCLYFPQATTITNETTGQGLISPNVFLLPSFVVNAVTNRRDFAFAIRFRPDLTRPNTAYAWLVSFGNSANGGFMLGPAATGKNIQTFKLGGADRTVTNFLSSVYFYYCGKGTTLNNGGTYPKIGIGVWNDLVVSVKNQEFSFFFSRDGNLWQPGASITNSAVANYLSTFYTWTVPDGYDASPRPGANIYLGGENYTAGTGQAWSNNVGASGANITKGFRGSIQSFALWTNALTEAEMREAAAWPRTEVWRVGVENGATTEFNGTGPSATVDVDEDRWNVPAALPAGGSVTFRFPLDTSGEAAMPQVFRIKPTGNSGSGTIRATVNGTALDSRLVAPGRTTRWFVPETLLVADATNTLQIVRTDSGASPVRIDSAIFGGSLQYGRRDGNIYTFGWEGHYQDKVNYWLVGANWFDGCRAVFGTGVDGEGRSSIHTNTVIRFSVPEEILANYDWRMKFRTTGTGTVNMNLNGRDLGTWNSNTTQDLAIPDDVMQAESALRFSNVRPYASGVYMSPVYISLYLVDRPRGTVLMLK